MSNSTSNIKIDFNEKKRKISNNDEQSIISNITLTDKDNIDLNSSSINELQKSLKMYHE